MKFWCCSSRYQKIAPISRNIESTSYTDLSKKEIENNIYRILTEITQKTDPNPKSCNWPGVRALLFIYKYNVLQQKK